MTCHKGKIRFQINCPSRGFHVYGNIWSPNIGQNLVGRQEVLNHHDPFATSVRSNIPGKLTKFDILAQLAHFVITLSITESLFMYLYEILITLIIKR